MQAALAEAYRAHWARLLALLTKQFGDLDLAEEALQEAFAAASRAWGQGPPENTAGWLMTAARRKGLDTLRRRAARERRHRQAWLDAEPRDEDDAMLPDERLGLIFMCCHPALSREAQVALTLRAVAGLLTETIARLFLVPVPTMAARLTRAKDKIRAARIPFREPEGEELVERIAGALAVIYLIFTEGYAPREEDAVVRQDLCEHAIRLGRAMVDVAPRSREARALLALMMLQHARRAARADASGMVLRLADQDRKLWARDEIAEGLAMLEAIEGEGFCGPYHLQAAIAAEHARADRPADWRVVAGLYALLEAVQPSPFARLNRAVAVMEGFGAARGLELLADVEAQLAGHGPMHLARGEMLLRIGERQAGKLAIERALELSGKAGERRYLAQRLREIG